MFSVPHVLLEDGEPITIAMLKTNKRKVAKQQSRRDNVPRAVKYADEEQERSRRRKRRLKRKVENEENRKKRKRGNPSRSSFYTVVHSPEKVKEFLLSVGFLPDAKPTEKYVVDICTCEEGVEFYIRLDEKLSFMDVKFPNLRWCLTDVKRKWQPRSYRDINQDGRLARNVVAREVLVRENVTSRNHGVGHSDGCQEGDDVMVLNIDLNQAYDDVTLDGWEMDIRFLLQSRYALPSQDVRDAKYARFQRVLKANKQRRNRPFTVQEDLWKDIRLIRFIKSTKFTSNAAQRGFLFGLTVYLDEVTEYSRPAQNVDEFRTKVTRWELSLGAELPEDLTEKDAMKTFLHEVWEFSFSLSSFVSH